MLVSGKKSMRVPHGITAVSHSFEASPCRPTSLLQPVAFPTHQSARPFSSFQPSQGILDSSVGALAPTISMTTGHTAFPTTDTRDIYEHPLMTSMMQYQPPAAQVSPTETAFGSYSSGSLAQAILLQAQGTISGYAVGGACLLPQSYFDPNNIAVETPTNHGVSVLPSCTSTMSVGNHTVADAKLPLNGLCATAQLDHETRATHDSGKESPC